MADYEQGGWLPAARTEVTIGVYEHIIGAADLRAGRWVCSRTDEAHLQAAHPDAPKEEPTDD